MAANILVSLDPGLLMYARFFLLIGASVLLTPALAIQQFQASIEQSRWIVESSESRCALTHPIPHYGEGRFVYSAGGELAFELRVLDVPVRDSVAKLSSVAPFWKPAPTKELGQLTLSRGISPIFISRDLAQRMLYELQSSMLPTIQYRDFADQTEDVVVVLSSANFKVKLPDFQRCIHQLQPEVKAQAQAQPQAGKSTIETTDAVVVGKVDTGLGYASGGEFLPNPDQGEKDVVVHFDVDKYALSPDAKEKLDQLVQPGIRGVHISVHGHTDDAGANGYNQGLSERRSQEVKVYLLNLGVIPGQISVQASGENMPVASNQTPEGRSLNRRVNVSVVRSN